MDTMALGTDFVKELEYYKKRCIEFENKSKNDEIKYHMLEVEFENLKEKKEELEEKIARIQKIVGDENVEDKFDELMIENSVLECEKQTAENKINKLVSRVCELESNMKNLNEKNEHDINMVSNRTRKQLKFEEIGCPSNKMAPSTPGVAKSRAFAHAKRERVLNIISSDDDDDDDDNNLNEINIRYSNIKNTKRKRAANIITSDNDSYDDNAPICVFKNKKHNSSFETESDNKVEENANQRRLTRLKKSESENKRGYKTGQSFDLNKSVCLDENSSSGEVAESEGESLGGFIVNASESGDSCDGSENAFSEYKETLDKIGRKKILKLKWDLEGEMLADFGKDPELCMRAVCCLYRQQTEDEKESKGTIYHNARGFSQPDAYRASKVAEFLTDGDSAGDLNKTVEELKQYDANGIKLCMALAAKYSKQLFTIYMNKEDKYFMPQ